MLAILALVAAIVALGFAFVPALAAGLMALAPDPEPSVSRYARPGWPPPR